MGLIARGIEERGIPTVYIGVIRDVMKLIRPPRAVFLDFPLGHPIGKPLQPDIQLAILKDVLRILETAREPGMLIDLHYEWEEPFTFVPGGHRHSSGR